MNSKMFISSTLSQSAGNEYLFRISAHTHDRTQSYHAPNERSGRVDSQVSDVVACDSTTVGTARTLIVWDRPNQLVGIDRQSQVEVGPFGGRFWDIKIPRWSSSSGLPSVRPIPGGKTYPARNERLTNWTVIVLIKSVLLAHGMKTRE